MTESPDENCTQFVIISEDYQSFLDQGVSMDDLLGNNLIHNLSEKRDTNRKVKGVRIDVYIGYEDDQSEVKEIKQPVVQRAKIKIHQIGK